MEQRKVWRRKSNNPSYVKQEFQRRLKKMKEK